MPTYEVNIPGRGTFEVSSPRELTDAEAYRYALQQSRPQAKATPAEPEGFLSALKGSAKAGFESLKGETALTAGKLGLMGLPEAEKYRAEREAESERIYRPTQKGYLEAPLTKFGELLGGSLPYMAAPIAAGAATLALPVTGTAAALAAGAAAGLTSAGQFTGSNLARQLEEVKRTDPNAGLEQTSGATAFIAAVPQAALDVVSFRALPLVRSLFKSVGKELTEEQAKAIAQQGYKRVLADYAATGARTAGIEGVTETGQQFIERLQAGLKIADADARREYVDSFIGGAVLGGAISPVGRYFERGSEQRRAEEVIGKAQEQESQRLAAEQEKKRQEQEAFKRTPQYMQQLNQEQVQLKDEIRQLNELLKDKTLDPTQKLEAQDRRKDIGKRLKEINDEIRSVVPARPVSALLAERQMEQETQGAPVVDEFGNVVSTTGRPFDAPESKGKDILRAPRSDVDIEAQVGPGYDTEINKLRAAEEQRIRELQQTLREAYQRSVAADERKDAKEKAEYDKLIASIAKQAEKGKALLAKSQIPMDMQMPFADAYDALAQAAEQTQVGTYDESVIDQILQKIQSEQPKAAVEPPIKPTGVYENTERLAQLDKEKQSAVKEVEKLKKEIEATISQTYLGPDEGPPSLEASVEYEKKLDELQKQYDAALDRTLQLTTEAETLRRGDTPARQQERGIFTDKIAALKERRAKAVQTRDKETLANIDAEITELLESQAGAPASFLDKQKDIFFELETVVDDLKQRRYLGIGGRKREGSTLTASLQKKATAIKGQYVNAVLQEIAQTRANNRQVGLTKDEELAIRARLDALLQEYITRSQALSASEIQDKLDQVVKKKIKFVRRDAKALMQLQNRIKANAAEERALAERIAVKPDKKLEQQLEALSRKTSVIVNTFFKRFSEPLQTQIVEVLGRAPDPRPLRERPFGAPKRAYELLQEGLSEVRETYMRPERRAAPQILKTEFPGYKLAPAPKGEPTKSRVVVTRDEKEEKISDTGRVRRKIEQAELKIERVRAMGELLPAVESAFDTFERMDKPSEALVDLVLEQADRILKGTDLPFKPSADITRRAKRPGAQNTAELLPQIKEAIKAEAPAPEVGGAQMDLFGEKELEPRAVLFEEGKLTSPRVAVLRRQLTIAKKKIKAIQDAKEKNAAALKKELADLELTTKEQRQKVLDTASALENHFIEELGSVGQTSTDLRNTRADLLKRMQELWRLLPPRDVSEFKSFNAFLAGTTASGKPVQENETVIELRQKFKEVEEIVNGLGEQRDLIRAKVAVDEALESERNTLKELESKRAELSTTQQKGPTEQGLTRRNIAVLTATKRKLAEIQAKNKRILEQRLGEIPGIRRGTEIVSVLGEVGRGRRKRLEVVRRERLVSTPVGKGAKKVIRRAEALDLSSTAAEAYALTAEEEKVLSPAEAAQALLRGTSQTVTATGEPGAVIEQVRRQRLKPLRGGNAEKARQNIAETSILRQRKAGKGKKAQTDEDLLKLLKAFEEGIARQNDDTVFRIEESGDTVVDLAEAQQRIDEFKSKLPEGVKFIYAETIMDAPKSFIQALYNQGMDQDSAKVRGGVLPDGTIVVVGENHTDMLDLEKTLAHELVGHYGVDTLLGPKGMDNLIEAVNAQKGGMEKLASDLGVYDEALGAALALQKVGASEQAQQRAAMRELIAHVEEARIDEDFKQKARRFLGELVGAIRAALRKMGLATLAEQKPSDIYFLLRQSRVNMAKGKAGAYVAGDQVVFRSAPRYSADVPANVIKTANKVVAAPPGVFDKVKANNSWLAVRTQFIDRFEPLERVAEQMKDSLKATQMMYYLRMFDQRMSFTSEVTNNGALILDKQKRKDGKEEIVVRSGGTTSLKDVANELSKATSLNGDAANMLFTTYLAALRADRVGLDTLNFNPDLTQKDLDEVKAYVERTPDVKNAFNAAREKYNEYNKGLINFLVQTGTLSKETGKKLSDTNDYIPFYRKQGGNAELVIGGEISPINIGSLKSQPYLNELVGDNSHILDFFTSSVQNTNLLTDMALRNLATRNVAFGLGEMNLLKRSDKEIAAKRSGIRKGKDAKGPEVIRFKIDGEDYYAEADTEALGIPSDLLVKGLEGISMTVPAAVRMLGIPAQLLRKFITRSPVYALRQIVRDSTAAVLVSGANVTPVASSLKELTRMVAGKSEGQKLLQERGILGGQVLTGTPEDMSKILRELVDGGKGWTLAMAKLDNLAVQGDASTRVVMYNNFRKQGLSDMEATLATLESMNFNRRGLSPSVYMLSMMVPFMNAQIQGLDVLYRAFKGKMPFNEQLKVREKLIQRGMMLAGVTIMYALMMEDDETYKNASPSDRYTNFFVKTPFFDEAVRVPIPFEIGYIFKSLPEMVMNTAFGDTEIKQIAPAIRKMLTSLVPGDIPAGIKPMIELMSNYSFYSGENIESEREQALMPAERYRAKTTELAKTLGGLFGVSPIKIDYLIRSYTGGLGLGIVGVADPVLAAGEKATPEKRASDMPIVGGLFQPKDAQGLINYAYDLVGDVEKRQRTLKVIEERGTPRDIEKFEEENAEFLDMAKEAGRFKKKMGRYAEEERAIREDPDMTASQKRRELDEIRAERIAFAKDMIAAVSESKRLAAR